MTKGRPVPTLVGRATVKVLGTGPDDPSYLFPTLISVPLPESLEFLFRSRNVTVTGFRCPQVSSSHRGSAGVCSRVEWVLSLTSES